MTTLYFSYFFRRGLMCSPKCGFAQYMHKPTLYFFSLDFGLPMFDEISFFSKIDVISICSPFFHSDILTSLASLVLYNNELLCQMGINEFPNMWACAQRAQSHIELLFSDFDCPSLNENSFFLPVDVISIHSLFFLLSNIISFKLDTLL